jgi:hypothetical protein
MTDIGSPNIVLDAVSADELTNSSSQGRKRTREDYRPRLRRREASEYLKEVHGLLEAPSTLAKKACLGGGPIFESFGRVPYYKPEALDRYAADRLSKPRRSTSDRRAEP